MCAACGGRECAPRTGRSSARGASRRPSCRLAFPPRRHVRACPRRSAVLALMLSRPPKPRHPHRAGKGRRPGRSLPCERCRVETCGSLQLPCGRLVILCERCALEFYDVLIQKIAECESTFEEFLVEQQERQDAGSKPQEQAPKSNGLQGHMLIESGAATARPASTSPLRGVERSGAGGSAVLSGVHRGLSACLSPASPASPKPPPLGDDFVAARSDVSVTLGGIAGGRAGSRRLHRFVASSSGAAGGRSPTNMVIPKGGLNGRGSNRERSRLQHGAFQRPATSAAAGEERQWPQAGTRDDSPSLWGRDQRWEGRSPVAQSQTGYARHASGSTFRAIGDLSGHARATGGGRAATCSPVEHFLRPGTTHTPPSGEGQRPAGIVFPNVGDSPPIPKRLPGVGRGASSLCPRGFLESCCGRAVRYDALSPAHRHARAIGRNRQSFLPKILG